MSNFDAMCLQISTLYFKEQLRRELIFFIISQLVYKLVVLLELIKKNG